MKHLIAYVEQHNAMCRMFPASGKPMDPRNLSPQDMVTLSNKLECDLSPENLCCDGELRGIELRRKTKLLTNASKELIALSMAQAVPVKSLKEALAYAGA